MPRDGREMRIPHPIEETKHEFANLQDPAGHGHRNHVGSLRIPIELLSDRHEAMKDSKAGKAPPDDLRGRELEQRHRDIVRRTESLALAMGELEQLALTVAQDLRAPLRGIAHITSTLLADKASVTPEMS